MSAASTRGRLRPEGLTGNVLETAVGRAWRGLAGSRQLQLALLAVFAVGWVTNLVRTLNDPRIGGLFRWIGVDFGFYLEQVGEFVHGTVGGLYSLAAEAPFRSALAAWSSTPNVALPVGPTPYPSIFAWLLQPLGGLSPALAFAIWTGLNLVAALVLAWRAATFFPPERRLLVGILALVPTAVILSIWFGQAQLLLSIAVGEAFVAFTRGRDRLGGLWLGLLIFKPQYLLLMLPILLWKRRWGAIAGFAIASMVIVGASAVVAGPSSVGGWAGSLVESATASGGSVLAAVAPEAMVNWRSLVGAVPVELSATVSLAIIVALSAATVGAVLYAWRGRWDPGSERFAGQMTLLVAGTVLAAYHSHVHGVSMIVVPLAAFLASRVSRDRIGRALNRAIRVDVALAIVMPWLWFAVLDRGHVTANRMVAIALAVGFVLLFALLELHRAPAVDPAPAPALAPA